MADCFLKLRQHTEANPVYVKGNLLLQAIEVQFPSKSPTLLYASIVELLQHSEDSLTTEACVLLLACSLESVEVALLQAEFEVLQALATPLVRDSSEYLAKYSVKIIEKLCQVITREEWMSWTKKAQLFEYLVSLLTSHSEMTRTQAVRSLIRLLRKSLLSVPTVIEHLENYIERSFGEASVRPELHVNLLYFVTALVQVIAPQAALRVLRRAFSLLNLSTSAVVLAQVFLTFEVSFASTVLTLDLARSYFTELLAHTPHVGGHERMQISYIQCLVQALLRMNALDTAECYNHIADGISTLSEYLLSGQFSVQSAASSSLQTVLKNCIHVKHAQLLGPERELVAWFEEMNIEGVEPIQKVAATVLYLLTERFHELLQLVFPVVTCLLEKVPQVTTRVLEFADSLAVQHSTGKQFKQLVGAAVGNLGIAQFLQRLPLKIHLVDLQDPNYVSLSRSWLLPILRESTRTATIYCFLTELLPIAGALTELQETFESKGQVSAARKYAALVYQLWELFPAFCWFQNWDETKVKILRKVLPGLAKQLGKGTGIAGLLAKGLRACIAPGTAAVFAEVQAKLLPIVLNTYLSALPERSLLELLKEYPMTPSYAYQLVKRLIQRVLEGASTRDTHQMRLLMELLSAVIGKTEGLEDTEKNVISSFVKMGVESPEGALQKKTYKLVLEYSKVDLGLAYEIVSSKEISLCSELARKDRLKLVRLLAESWGTQEILSNMTGLLSELLHCIKSPSQKGRNLARDFLLSLAARFQEEHILKQFLDCVLAGLMSPVHATKAATVKLLQLTVLSFPSALPTAFIRDLALTVSLLLKQNNREVNKSALGFLKGSLRVLDVEAVQSLSHQILAEALQMPGKDAVLGKIRYLIAKFIKKISFQTTLAAAPAQHRMLVSNVNHRLKRLKPAKGGKQLKKSLKEDEDEDVSQLFQQPPAPEPSAPREHHFLDPSAVPATLKTKKLPSKPKFDDVQFQDGKIHVQELAQKRLRGSSGAPTTKKRQTEDLGITVRASGKGHPKAYVQFSAQILNKRKQVKIANTLNALVSTAKSGVLKGLRARKKG